MSNYAEDATVYIYFWTVDKLGNPVAPSTGFTTADFKIFKNGSDTEKLTDNGLTVDDTFNAIVGFHQLKIDTNVNTGDTGWWVSGADYTVVMDTAKTADGVVASRHWDFAIDTTHVLTVTTVSVANDEQNFTLTGGPAVADAYVGQLVQVVDATDGHTETRRIGDYTAGRAVTTAAMFGFTPDAGDVVRVLAAYGVTNADRIAGVASGAKIQSECNDALVALNLDHLMKTACGSSAMAAEVSDATVLSYLMANGDTSAFVSSTDGLKLIRDAIAILVARDGGAGTTAQGAVSETQLTATQYAALGPYTFTASVAQTGDGHAFTCWDPATPGTVAFQYTGAAGVWVSGDGDVTVTVPVPADPDENTTTAKTYCYVVRNTTDDTRIGWGTLTVEAVPDVSS